MKCHVDYLYNCYLINNKLLGRVGCADLFVLSQCVMRIYICSLVRLVDTYARIFFRSLEILDLSKPLLLWDCLARLSLMFVGFCLLCGFEG